MLCASLSLIDATFLPLEAFSISSMGFRMHPRSVPSYCTLSRFLFAATEHDSWGFDAVGRGEVGVTARWHYDKRFARRPTVLGSTFMGGKAKVRGGSIAG